jgi:hypothetical protein
VNAGTPEAADTRAALHRFEVLFERAWALADRAEKRLHTERPRRATQLTTVLRQLARAREGVLHGDWLPGAPGGGLGLTGLVSRGFELDLDLPDVADAARDLEREFDEGLGLSWDWRRGRPVGWADAVQKLPTAPALPEQPSAEPLARWWDRWRRAG